MINAAAKLSGTAARMAADSRFQKLLQFLRNSARHGATGSTKAMPKGELAQSLGIRFVPDAIGGAVVGATTPGDLGDKVIAGTTDALAGAIGGVGLTGVTRAKGMAGLATDIAGSMGGAYGSMPISEQLLKMKDKMSGGAGMSPYEKLDAQRRAEIEHSVLAKLGFGPMY